MKHILPLFAILLLTSPLIGFAAPTDIQGFGRAIITFINNTLVTFLFALALLVFIYNVIRFFILDNDAYSERAKAKRYMIWSISAFVLMVSIWGVVNLLVGGMGLGRSLPVCPDSISDEECRKMQGNNYDASPLSQPTYIPPATDYSLSAPAPIEPSGSSVPYTNRQNPTPPPEPSGFEMVPESTAPQRFDPELEAAYEAAEYDLLVEFVDKMQSMADAGTWTQDASNNYIQHLTSVLNDPTATYEEKKSELNDSKSFVSSDTYNRTIEAFEAMYAPYQ